MACPRAILSSLPMERRPFEVRFYLALGASLSHIQRRKSSAWEVEHALCCYFCGRRLWLVEESCFPGSAARLVKSNPKPMYHHFSAFTKKSTLFLALPYPDSCVRYHLHDSSLSLSHLVFAVDFLFVIVTFFLQHRHSSFAFWIFAEPVLFSSICSYPFRSCCKELVELQPLYNYLLLHALLSSRLPATESHHAIDNQLHA